MAFEVADTALQMHGGYGYMQNTRLLVPLRHSDASHYGGANEIMKELISRELIPKTITTEKILLCLSIYL